MTVLTSSPPFQMVYVLRGSMTFAFEGQVSHDVITAPHRVMTSSPRRTMVVMASPCRLA
jgi:hypothetical protein